MKKPFSLLFIFSAFAVVALPFFLNPNLALAAAYKCTCDSTAGTYASCTKNSDCTVFTSQEYCEQNADCIWSNGASQVDTNLKDLSVQCQSSDSACGVSICDGNNNATKCCNNTARTNCGAWCAVHPGCSAKFANCSGGNADNPCGTWCENSEALPKDECCDGTSLTTCIEAGILNFDPCDSTKYPTCTEECNSSSDSDTPCCNGPTHIWATCGAISTAASATANLPTSSGTPAATTSGGVCVCGKDVMPNVVSPTDCTNTGTGCMWYGTTPAAVDAAKYSSATDLANPLGTGGKDVPTLINTIIKSALGVVGSLALIMFIYGGFTWMLAAGNEQAVDKGKNILTWATIGLVVIFASYSLVGFVIKAITGSN